MATTNTAISEELMKALASQLCSQDDCLHEYAESCSGWSRAEDVFQVISSAGYSLVMGLPQDTSWVAGRLWVHGTDEQPALSRPYHETTLYVVEPRRSSGGSRCHDGQYS